MGIYEYSLEKDVLIIRTGHGQFKFKIDNPEQLEMANSIAGLVISELQSIEQQHTSIRDELTDYAKLMLASLNICEKHLALKTKYKELNQVFGSLQQVISTVETPALPTTTNTSSPATAPQESKPHQTIAPVLQAESATERPNPDSKTPPLSPLTIKESANPVPAEFPSSAQRKPFFGRTNPTGHTVHQQQAPKHELATPKPSTAIEPQSMVTPSPTTLPMGPADAKEKITPPDKAPLTTSGAEKGTPTQSAPSQEIPKVKDPFQSINPSAQYHADALMAHRLPTDLRKSSSNGDRQSVDAASSKTTAASPEQSPRTPPHNQAGHIVPSKPTISQTPPEESENHQKTQEGASATETGPEPQQGDPLQVISPSGLPTGRRSTFTRIHSRRLARYAMSQPPKTTPRPDNAALKTQEQSNSISDPESRRPAAPSEGNKQEPPNKLAANPPTTPNHRAHAPAQESSPLPGQNSRPSVPSDASTTGQAASVFRERTAAAAFTTTPTTIPAPPTPSYRRIYSEEGYNRIHTPAKNTATSSHAPATNKQNLTGNHGGAIPAASPLAPPINAEAPQTDKSRENTPVRPEGQVPSTPELSTAPPMIAQAQDSPTAVSMPTPSGATRTTPPTKPIEPGLHPRLATTEPAVGEKKLPETALATSAGIPPSSASPTTSGRPAGGTSSWTMGPKTETNRQEQDAPADERKLLPDHNRQDSGGHVQESLAPKPTTAPPTQQEAQPPAESSLAPKATQPVTPPVQPTRTSSWAMAPSRPAHNESEPTASPSPEARIAKEERPQSSPPNNTPETNIPTRPGTPPSEHASTPGLQRSQDKQGQPTVPSFVINRPEYTGHGPLPPETPVVPGEYRLPLLSFLNEISTDGEIDHNRIRSDAELLEKKLGYFGIKGEVMGVSPGPVITTYEYKPDPGVKISKIVNLADDLALALSAYSIRIVAPIPGKDVMGIEIPNIKKSLVPFLDIVSSDAFLQCNSKVPICLGKDIIGNPVVVKLDSMPHLLIAGATGTGKSVGLNAMITSILYRANPDEVKFLMIDPKRIELSFYNDIPHLLTPVITDMNKANIALQWMVREMDRRYNLLAEYQVRHIEQFNQKLANAGGPQYNEDGELLEPLPFIVVIIDELADLMMTASRDIECSLTRLAQMARAAGIHLILATQRPSVDVLTGIIKANFPTRISFQVSSKTDSRTIIDSNGAETLLGNGDMLFVPPGTARLIRVHGTYLSEAELVDITRFIKKQRKPNYIFDVVTEPESDDIGTSSGEDEYDEKYDEALEVVVASGQASISSIQRALRVGYNRAARIIDLMEKEGIVGPSDGVKPRKVLINSMNLM